MAVRYHVLFECKNGEVVITQEFNGSTDTSSIPMKKISDIEKMCKHFNWSQSGVSQQIGKFLYAILNGENQLESAITKADAHGEPLQLFIRRDNSVPDLPFELLYKSGFIVPSKVHVIRHVSDYGCKKKVESQSRPLKVLFMACSPENVSPVLDYEKEEETILEVTKDFPVQIDVEDTGSLQGLKECLAHYYDVVHISGHADIDENGTPIFLMEDETGYPVPVTPLDLWDALKRNPPRLLFLSGCRTGQTPPHEAAVSFAHELVLKHSSTILGWGLPVLDPGARMAAASLFFELSRGKSILDAVFSARQELYDKKWPDWSLLRLFSDGTPLDVPLVEEGQELKVKTRDIQYAYLQNSQVKVLEKGFIGRRRQIQKGISSLKKDKQKVGLLLHGTGGLGKSCLAGKFCDRFKDHTLVIVHGDLNAVTFLEAAKNAFIQKRDDTGLKILEEKEEMPDKIRKLCLSTFQKGKYLILLDDFEKNLEGYEQGTPVVSGKAAPILGSLLLCLPLAVKMSQLIITSRYTFPFTVQERDLVTERLEPIGLTSFRGADERKKVAELKEIAAYENTVTRQKLIEAGRGNPRLMEALNSLLEVEKDVDVKVLLEMVKGKQEEFVQELILKEILKSQSQDFQKVMQYLSVYGLPVSRKGIEIVCKEIKNWVSSVDSGVQLSLIEKGKDKVSYYWVTPLLREAIFGELSEDEQMRCHEAAVKHYQAIVSADGYQPVYAFELIDHALLCGMDEAAIGEGGRLLPYLRNALLHKEALFEGMHILSHISKLKRNKESSFFLNEFGMILCDGGDFQKAITCFEQALEIAKEIYGEKHPDVATRLNNLGLAWYSLGDSKKAIDYYEQALTIDREIYGERHPSVATMLNNLGLAWKSLGDPKKAIEYYEQALKIDKEIYGEKHPYVATMLNNLGLAWKSL
ncbi:MAG: tetratricopeptide repeat protein, partial [Theionarchaea archaeon]|nr:tetratricopeptide repeat protein [Theionarchaea archaeon]